MSIKYIRKESGTAKMLDRSTDAPIEYDTADGFLKYGDGGKNRPIVAAGRPLPIVSLAAATLTLSPDLHDGRILRVDIAAGATITLPAATGSGACYRIIVGTSLTSGSLVLAVASATDYLRGQAYAFSGATASTFGTANTGTVATESDTITFNRSTTGLGTQGDFIELIDLAAAVWAVEADYAASGSAATPFSVAV